MSDLNHDKPNHIRYGNARVEDHNRSEGSGNHAYEGARMATTTTVVTRPQLGWPCTPESVHPIRTANFRSGSYADTVRGGRGRLPANTWTPDGQVRKHPAPHLIG
jgi:hypothetical protein